MFIILLIPNCLWIDLILPSHREAQLYAESLTNAASPPLFQILFYNLDPSSEHIYLWTLWWQQLLALWQFQCKRAGTQSVKYLPRFLCPALFTTGNDSGGSGGRIKYKEELPLPRNPESAWV